jgi:5-methylcytosine-specific restriction protein A
MPDAPRRPCGHPGCPALTSGSRFCPEHSREFGRGYEKDRGTAASRGYDARWQRIRARVLNEEPLCRFCLDDGHVTMAEVVDHVDGDSRNNARRNLRPLCERCHNSRTARDQGFFRKR